MNKVMLALLLCIFTFNTYSQLTRSKESVDRGLWVRVSLDEKELTTEGQIRTKIERAKQFIDEENQENSYANPWVGINLQLTWGQLYDGTNYNEGIIKIQEALNTADSLKLFVQLSIADKYRSNVEFCECDDITKCEDDYFRGPTPKIKKTTFNQLDHQDFDQFIKENRTTSSDPVICVGDTIKYYSAFHVSKYRYARQQNVSQKKKFLRKYFSVRWNSDVKKEWLFFWEKLGKRIGSHPALHSIITPESSNSLTNRELLDNLILPGTNPRVVNPDNAFKYPGGAAYASYLASISIELRKYFPSNVLIINNTNWLFPNEKPDGTYYQEDVANLYLDQNATSTNNITDTTVGWFSQDLVLPISRVDAYYPRGVYKQMKRFPQPLRFGMITGETEIAYRNATDKENDRNRIPQSQITPSILELTNELGLANLVFISEKRVNPYREAIKNAQPGDYPFMPNATYYISNKATGDRLKIETSQREIATTDANDDSDAAKWELVYEDRQGLDTNSFQLVNVATRELIKYNNNSASSFAKRIEKIQNNSDNSIKYKTTFWKTIPRTTENYFYLENFGSEKLLAHDPNKDPALHQTNFRGKKTEWTLEKAVSTSSNRSSKKELAMPTTTTNELILYPNPVAHTIQLSNSNEATTYIYDLSGKLIKSISGNQNTIDVSSLNNGVFFLKRNDNIVKFIKK